MIKTPCFQTFLKADLKRLVFRHGTRGAQSKCSGQQPLAYHLQQTMPQVQVSETILLGVRCHVFI